ncbi:MAG: 6-phosphofructokinase, partial [Verrucomicrobiae bacterium]|nr:6-phosphofructokinase [Verrucomicrobiae bacterium]
QTLGAWTAAEQGARFFRNIANENTTSYRQLIVHEVMGRNCGWLTARTAFDYRQSLHEYDWLPEALLHNARWDLDAVWVPELEFDFDAEVERLRRKMDEHDSVNIFLSEGAGVEAIVHQIETETGESVPRDAFGHVRLDEINVGNWFANQLRGRLSAEKVLVQKSGYFARSAAPNAADLDLIVRSAAHAAEGALQGRSGVAGLDEDNGGEMNIIPFPKIKGGKPFDHTQAWFRDMLGEIGQPLGKPVTVGH